MRRQGGFHGNYQAFCLHGFAKKFGAAIERNYLAASEKGLLTAIAAWMDQRPMKFDTLRGYGIAIGSVVLVGAVRLAVAPMVHNRLSSAFFLLAIILTGRYGGFGPSWLALLLGAAASAYVTLSGPLTADVSSLLPGYLLVYIGLGVVLVYFSRSDRAGQSKDERVHGGALPISLLETQEREKQTLCYEIHDGMIQYATGALLLLDGYRRSHPTANDTETLARVSDGLRHAVDEGRRVIRGLRPTVLDEGGVVAGLEDLVKQTTAAGLQVDFRKDASFERLPNELETAIYRIAQEALTNASKHSGTDRVIVELASTTATSVWTFKISAAVLTFRLHAATRWVCRASPPAFACLEATVQSRASPIPARGSQSKSPCQKRKAESGKPTRPRSYLEVPLSALRFPLLSDFVTEHPGRRRKRHHANAQQRPNVVGQQRQPCPSRYTRWAISMAYRSGLNSVANCNTWGILLMGVASPESSVNGMMNMNEKSIACCMVAAAAEISKLMPTASSKKRLSHRAPQTADERDAEPELSDQQDIRSLDGADNQRRAPSGDNLDRSQRRDQQLIESPLFTFTGTLMAVSSTVCSKVTCRSGWGPCASEFRGSG